jgi:hypothetical protein
MTQADIWNAWTPPDTLAECVKLFFEILDTKEESSFGREFHPTKFNPEDKVINSCRVWDTHRLKKLMPKMKELASSEVNPPINT